MSFKPRLLRETAEIALTEIKRFLEPRLAEEFSLRRVSAPLFLPVDSQLLDPRHPGVRIHLPAMSVEMEIVSSLDVWLRSQLSRYDIASGFGVFTIMNAIRPELPVNSTSSPHIAAWAWQQAVEPHEADCTALVDRAKRLYAVIVETEKMILEKFPHLTSTLHKTLDVVDEAELAGRMPRYSEEKRIYEHLHPGRCEQPEHRHGAALLVTRGSGDKKLTGDLWVWNCAVNRPLRIVDFAVWDADAISGTSIGGNIYRDYLALQLLHQDRLLV